MLLVLAGSAAYSLQIVLMERYAPRYDPVAFTQAEMLAAFAGFAVVAVALGQVELPRGWTVWGALLVTGIFASALGFLVQTWAQRQPSATRTALAFAMEPVFAGFFGFWLAGDRLGAVGWGGCALIMAGIVVAEPEAGRTLRRLVGRGPSSHSAPGTKHLGPGRARVAVARLGGDAQHREERRVDGGGERDVRAAVLVRVERAGRDAVRRSPRVSPGPDEPELVVLALGQDRQLVGPQLDHATDPGLPHLDRGLRTVGEPRAVCSSSSPAGPPSLEREQQDRGCRDESSRSGRKRETDRRRRIVAGASSAACALDGASTLRLRLGGGATAGAATAEPHGVLQLTQLGAAVVASHDDGRRSPCDPPRRAARG